MNVNEQPIIKRQPALAQQVSDHLTRQIKDGVLSPGDLLPSEADLAKQLQVSRTVVREALARMKHDGLLDSKKGGRTRVARDVSGQVFRLAPEQEESIIANLFEMRFIIEPEAAALAAVRGTDEALALVKAAFDRLQEVVDRGQESTQESWAFHKAMVAASGNPQLARFLSWVEKKLWSFSYTQNPEENAELAVQAQKEHVVLLESLLSRDADVARDVARRHVVEAANRHGVDLSMLLNNLSIEFGNKL